MCSTITWEVSGAGTIVVNACQGGVNDDWHIGMLLRDLRKFTGTSMNAGVTVMVQGGPLPFRAWASLLRSCTEHDPMNV
eukprot:6473575-Amphidinium_carterae.1